MLLNSFEWSYTRVSCDDLKVKTILYSVLNSTTRKYYSIAFMYNDLTMIVVLHLQIRSKIRVSLAKLLILLLQGVESVFDIMDLEDEERNKLLRLDDSPMQVRDRNICTRCTR